MALEEVMAGAETMILEKDFRLTEDSQRRRKTGVSSSRRRVTYHNGSRLVDFKVIKQRQTVLRIRLRDGAYDSSLDIDGDGTVVAYHYKPLPGQEPGVKSPYVPGFQVGRDYADAISEMMKVALEG